MKTAGATFRHHIRANFASAEVYPDKRFDPDLTVANVRLDYLTSLPASRRAAIRAYTGHFPFVATDLLGGPLLTMTILRDPVDRTISFLKHCKRYNQHHHDLRLEAIYEDPFVFRCLIQNHQAKLFALLKPEDAIGVTLTSAFQLVPESSTSAIVVHHPQASYYLVKE